MLATDSTHCSRGVDTKPPKGYFGMPADYRMARAALSNESGSEYTPKKKV
jgi:hypothetical protein